MACDINSIKNRVDQIIRKTVIGNAKSIIYNSQSNDFSIDYGSKFRIKTRLAAIATARSKINAVNKALEENGYPTKFGPYLNLNTEFTDRIVLEINPYTKLLNAIAIRNKAEAEDKTTQEVLDEYGVTSIDDLISLVKDETVESNLSRDFVKERFPDTFNNTGITDYEEFIESQNAIPEYETWKSGQTPISNNLNLVTSINDDVYDININRNNETLGNIKAFNDGSYLNITDVNITQPRQGIGSQAIRQLGEQALTDGLQLRSDLINSRMNEGSIALWNSLVRDGVAIQSEDRYVYTELQEIIDDNIRENLPNDIYKAMYDQDPNELMKFIAEQSYDPGSESLTRSLFGNDLVEKARNKFPDFLTGDGLPSILPEC